MISFILFRNKHFNIKVKILVHTFMKSVHINNNENKNFCHLQIVSIEFFANLSVADNLYPYNNQLSQKPKIYSPFHR